MKTILAIDPGNTHSGWTIIDAATRRPLAIGKDLNEDLHYWITADWTEMDNRPTTAAIEMIASYGMAVGATVFDTCVWIGRFHEALRNQGLNATLIYRQPIKLHHCKTSAAKDANVTQALLDRFTPGEPNYGKGTKQNPGWFHGFKADIWQAYALAVYTADQQQDASDSGTVGDVSKCPDAQEPPLGGPVAIKGTPAPVDVPAFVVGSLVRVGRGKKLWRVERLWADRPVASLVPVDGYTGTTVDVERLVAVDEREVAA